MTANSINPFIEKIKPYQPGKTTAEIQREYGIDYIVKLASNENPFGISPKVKSVLSQQLSEVARYPEDQAPELRNRLSENLKVTPKQITFGAGSSELFEFVMRIYAMAGDEVIVTEHAFILYKILAQVSGVKAIAIPDQNWQQDLNSILNSITEKTRIIFLANPNNPTGSWIPYNELSSFIETVPSHIKIVIDEAYYEYMWQDAYATALPLIEKHSNLIVTRTFSKAYGLAGLRIGYGITTEEIADLFNRLRKPFNVNLLALAAANAALQDKTFLDETVIKTKEGVVTLSESLQELSLPKPIAHSGNFITVDFGTQAQNVFQKLLHAGVILRPLLPYNMPNHLRITIGTEKENQFFIKKLQSLVPFK